MGLHELGSHDPHAEVDHGLESRGVENGRGAEELRGGNGGEELLDVVEVEGGGGGWREEDGG